MHFQSLQWPELTEWSVKSRPQIYGILATYLAINLIVSRWTILPQIRLRRLWALWNLLLAVQSLATFVAILPWYMNLSWNEVICERFWQQVDDQWITRWNSVFVLSKIIELGDTVFLWLDHKPVNFLHWFHHATVLLQSWHSMEEHATSGYTFVVMNSGIHAIMQFQYFLALCKIRAPSWIAALITALQTSQMIAGIFVQSYVIDKIQIQEAECGVTKANALAGSLMYFAYLVLFLQQAVDRQVFKNKND